MPRCAIYTRKSTEEGLEQDFNSLHAQREACEAFIRSQRHEGWRLVRESFDDGGYSGGTMDRPALVRLLDAVKRREIDIVVVYKVDRLTRSLTDFAKIVEMFDVHGVSFVSVTQQFNTTTSMGRLTLNVLLSFAQFEREVTAERIRDKIAASKKKGLWMGGPPPLGYDSLDRGLVVNRREAETVRTLFRLYLELGTVRRLKEEADRLGIVSKRRRYANGTRAGGKPLSRGNLYQILSNPLYIGRVPHRGETYPGQHAAIIDDKTWCAVQERLIGNGANRRYATNAKAESLLTGMVFDETGERLSPSHARKKGRHHRYYISRRLMHGADRRDDGWRLPAQELERAVIAPIQGLLRDPWRLIDLLQIGDQKPATVTRIRQRAEALAAELQGNDSTRRRIILRELIDRIDLSASSLVIGLNRPGLGRALEIDMPSDKGGQGNIVRITAPIALRRRGVESKLVLAGHDKAPDVPDPQLCRLIAQARLWFDELAFGNATSVRAIARREGVDESDVSRILPLAFLAPDIVEAILAGRQAVELTAESLKRLRSLPADWAAQRRVLGFTG